MLPRLMLIAIPAMALLAGCEGMMLPTADANTVSTVGAVDTNTTATTPQGIVAAQLANPSSPGECERLANTIENSESGSVAIQGAIEERERLGCP